MCTEEDIWIKRSASQMRGWQLRFLGSAIFAISYLGLFHRPQVGPRPRPHPRPRPCPDSISHQSLSPPDSRCTAVES